MLLERGHVAQWLACAPFEPDVTGGVVAALRRGEAPLGDRDYLAPLGGVARVRPRPRLAAPGAAREAVWQEMAATTPCLDLAGLFGGMAEGVAYAAFYVQADAPRAALFDLQTPLGARVWLNGFPLRDIRPASVAAAGSDQFLASFRQGDNLVLIQYPGASFERIAQASGMDAREWSVRGFAHRPLLTGNSGYELGLRVYPAEALSDVQYVPVLERAGTFSGSGVDMRQDCLLTLFNAGGSVSPPIDVAITGRDIVEPIVRRLRPIPAGTILRETIPIPIGDTLPGRAFPVTVRLTIEDASGAVQAATFAANITAEARGEGGRVYLVTGQRYRPDAPEDQAMESNRRIASMLRQTALMDREPDYGFDLGAASQWRPMMDAHPASREDVLHATALGRCAAQAPYTVLDERLAGGETLLRNIAYGMAAAHSILRDSGQAYFAWDVPGIAPQTPQLLAQAEVPGIVSNLEIHGLAPLFRQLAPDGSDILHRRRQSAPGPARIEELRGMAAVRRRELLEWGITIDVLVMENLIPPPEPFFLGAASALARSVPAYPVTGRGASEFLEAMRRLPPDTADRIPHNARLMSQSAPGAAAVQSRLKSAFFAAENRLSLAERYATLAALAGAEYPGKALDLAWRQLLHQGAVDRLGLAQHKHTYLDTLAGCREALELASEITQRATAYLAQEADTRQASPPDAPGLRALVVFNPSSHARTDICETVLTPPAVEGFSIVDEFGNRTPFFADRIQMERDRLITSARIRFVAGNVPAMGYRTYYFVPEGLTPRPSEQRDAQIENDSLIIRADPNTGDLISIKDKRSGAEYLSGAANQIVLLTEDPARTNGGWDVWTAGTAVSTGAGGASVRSLVTETIQQLHIEMPFAGGRLVREITLSQGAPRVDCELRVEGVSLENRMLLVTSETPAHGRGPRFGERFAAISGTYTHDGLQFRSQGRDMPAGAGTHAAAQWAAITPDDHIQIGAEHIIPLTPAIIVHGPDAILGRAAREVLQAFIRRGIPAAIRTETPPQPDFLWSDATELADIAEEFRQGAGMAIIIGGPAQNAVCGQVADAFSGDTASNFAQRLEQGAAILTHHAWADSSDEAVPTLLFAALLPERAAALAEDFAASIARHGAYALAPSALLSGTPQPYAPRGLAVLFPGSRLCSADKSGALSMILARGGEPFGLSPAPAQRFRYALLPFEGDWREADVPFAAAAFNESFHVAMSEIRPGRLPLRHGFLEVERPGFIVSALKTPGYPYAAMSFGAGGNHPRNGFIVRGWQSTSEVWDGALRFFTPLVKAATSTLLEYPGESLALSGDTMACRVPGFAVTSWWVLPSIKSAPGEAAPLARTSDPHGPVYTRYWQHNAGCAPLGNLPISLLIQGALSGDNPKLEVVVANNTIDRTLEGLVHIEASQDWSVGPSQFAYRLEPNALFRKELTAIPITSAADTNAIAVWTMLDGQTYRDVLIPMSEPLAVQVTQNESQFKVRVVNRCGIAAEGVVDLISPCEFWPETGDFPEISIMPRRAALAVPPFGAQDVLFRISNPSAKTWVVAKVAANGQVVYALPGPAQEEKFEEKIGDALETD